MEGLSEIFDLLSKERRRYALYYLEKADRPVRIDELAKAINEWENGSSVSGFQEEEYDEVVLTLKHSHLPKAAEFEYIDYDTESNRIQISGSPPKFKAILHIAEAIEAPTHEDITSTISRL